MLEKYGLCFKYYLWHRSYCEFVEWCGCVIYPFANRNGHKARSAGTEQNARVKVTPGLLGWADLIFCMEKKHLRRIKEKYSDIVVNKKLICLYISDDYEFMDRELQELLESYVDEYI